MRFTRTLKAAEPMMRGDDVKVLQVRLREKGFTEVGQPDGLFGSGTKTAVEAFQGAAGLIVDGIVGPATWRALFEEVDAPAPPPPPTPPPPPDLLDGLTSDHNFNGGVSWRLSDRGVLIGGASAPETTGPPPRTVGRAWDDFGEAVLHWAAHYAVPVELIIATMCTESGARPDRVREEPGYVSDEATPNKVSPGLMQTLISTAREALGRDDIDRAWLLEPANSIQAGTCYIAKQRGKTDLDPPKVACAYNAGGVYAQNGAENRWKMRQYPIGSGKHADRFIKWFNDCFVLFDERGLEPEPSFYKLLQS